MTFNVTPHLLMAGKTLTAQINGKVVHVRSVFEVLFMHFVHAQVVQLCIVPGNILTTHPCEP
jgi:hypothetical protein